VASALVLFGAGACLAYFLMPLWLNLLTSIVGSNAIFFPDLNQYLSFLTLLIVAFGVTFELPVVIVLLGLLGVISSGWLRRRRKLAWGGLVLGAELVTPGVDPFTPLFPSGRALRALDPRPRQAAPALRSRVHCPSHAP
jgi:sec-independent protein translocase protein TatC